MPVDFLLVGKNKKSCQLRLLDFAYRQCRFA